MSWRSPIRQLLVVTGLTGFAISQPLLSILGDAPTELAFYGLQGWSMVWLACLIAFVPPLLLWGASQLAGLAGHRLDRTVHLLTIAALVGLFAIQVGKSLGLSAGIVLLGLAVLTGAGFAFAYVRVAPVSLWASYTAVLPVAAVAFFLVASPASALLGTPEAPERVAGADELPSVVMVVLDELPTRSILDRDDGIDAERFPHLAAFAEDATWYRHNTSLATFTEVAVPTILTGTLPVAEEAVWTNHPDNLFTWLAPTHELEVIEQATELCPYDVCEPTGAGDAAEALDLGGPGFGDLLGVTRDLWFDRVALAEDGVEGFDDFAETLTTTADIGPSVTTAPDPDDQPDVGEGQALTSARTQALIESFDASKGPAVYYLHLMVPHQPFKRYPDGTEYGVIDPLGEDLPREDQAVLFSWSPWVSTVSEQQHLLQAQYADRLVGEILQGLREAGLYDDSLVIVTSDHGISFEDRTAPRFVEPSSVDAIAYAPLFVKAPGQSEGTIDDSNMTAVDVLPTIADLLGIEVTWDVDGAPAGSDAIAARGSAKQIYDVVAYGGVRIRGVLDFDDGEEFRTVGDRLLGPLRDLDDPLSALYDQLSVDDVIGVPVADLHAVDGGGALTLAALDQLEHPGEVPLGAVPGIVEDLPEGTVVLLAVDGTVVAGSEISITSDGESWVTFLLPEGVLDGDNEIRAVALTDGVARDLELGS